LLVAMLAGGRGERLRPLTDNVPKPMVPVIGRPFLEIQMKYLASQGLTDFVLLTGYRGDAVSDYFGDGSRFGWHVNCVRELKPLGTGGALRNAADYLAEPFLLVNGDSFLPMDYSHLAQEFARDWLPRIVTYGNREHLAPNNMHVVNGRVVLCCSTGPDMNCVHAGVRALIPEVISSIPEGFVSIEDSVYRPLLRKGKLFAYETEERYYDIGTPAGLASFEEQAKLAGWA